MSKLNSVLDISLPSVLSAISSALDSIHPALQSHQKRTCVIASHIAKNLNFNSTELQDTFNASIIHDLGALGTQNRINLLNFEEIDADLHANMGAALISQSEVFKHLTLAIKYHHKPWLNGQNSKIDNEEVPLLAQLIHLSDRIEVLCHSGNLLSKAEIIRRTIQEKSGEIFHPDLVKVFLELSSKEVFWFQISSENIDSSLVDLFPSGTVALNREMLDALTSFISLIIDSRSHFTARHSAGVAKSSELLGSLMGLSSDEAFNLKIAGYLHDIGKLAIPTELLEKPSALTADERALIKSHVYQTYQILRKIKGFESITEIAIMHHERNNGHGYPFGKLGSELNISQKIMEVADIFTALAETRPYREALQKKEVLSIIGNQVKNNELDQNIFDCLALNYDEIWEKVKSAQSLAEEKLLGFWKMAHDHRVQ